MKCKYDGDGVWKGRCTGTKEVDPCPGHDKCERFVPVCECTKTYTLIAVPCNVGEVVWAYRYSWRPEDGIFPYKITNLTITQNKKGIWTKKFRAMLFLDGRTRDWSLDFSFDDLGKSVFLTREEAEAALKGGES